MRNVSTLSKKILLAPLLFGLSFFTGCEPQEEVVPSSLNQNMAKGISSTYYGPTTWLWGGSVRTWVEMMNGHPTAMGLELSEEALINLPHEPSEYFLKLPGQLHATGIKSISIGWNPDGHEPDGVYTLPHFDFHFYMMTQGQIMNIEGGLDEGAYSLMARGVLPATYVFGPAPFAVPHMGLHWSDVTSPEFSPAGFSKTFIYGSNQDKVTFLEPMITLAYMQSLMDGMPISSNIPALNIVDDPGYYPSAYTLEYDADRGVYIIALTGLTFRNK
ncbi:hypothetical protein GU926_13275 [Nibribacter ruber]|uniref:DUF5602 domain-containing protein n=1 Tax=Nibribacter ruber TaxID=2698458 RepID=A0A6P1P0U6_9BACT|nr:hypothetical protein [Nibribacter ruber]QHL88349.1 hypothetical protein GU926_13275 [Nibribacter ruber]